MAQIDSIEAEQIRQDPAALVAFHCTQSSLSPTEEIFLCQVHPWMFPMLFNNHELLLSIFVVLTALLRIVQMLRPASKT